MSTVDVPALALLGMGATLPATEAYEFVSSTLKNTETISHTNGIRGKRDQDVDRQRITREDAGGTIVLNPSVTELDRLWSRMLGGETALGVTETADTLPSFQITEDKLSDVYDYNDCVVSRWILAGTSGEPLTLTLEIVAKSESTTGRTNCRQRWPISVPSCPWACA